ncbi:MAG: hypothetical protein ACI8RD_013982 [Bacillariaceae sp.]|jgi:hypothetical protein
MGVKKGGNVVLVVTSYKSLVFGWVSNTMFTCFLTLLSKWVLKTVTVCYLLAQQILPTLSKQAVFLLSFIIYLS